MKKKTIYSLLLAFVLLLSICGQNIVSAAETSVETNVSVESSPLKVGVLFSPDDTLDPTVVTSPGGMLLMMSIYDSLVSMSSDGAILRMAKSIEVNDELNEYTITLKEDGLLRRYRNNRAGYY